MTKAAFALCLLLLAGLRPAMASDLIYASIGTGTYGGGYYATARALCARINAAERGRMRCAPEATAGSIYNLRALEAGEVDLAIAQSDWSFNALNGYSVFAGEGMTGAFRGVGALYVEAVTILAAQDSGITRAIDLIGRRIDVGRPASGRRATVQVALEAFAVDTDAFAEVAEFADDVAIEALCTGAIDATILTLGHPSALVRRAVEGCGARLIPLAGPAVESLIDGAPYYVTTDVPAGTYEGQDDAVASFGVRAFLLARTSLDDAVVSRLAEELIAVTSTGAPMPAVMTEVTSAQLPDVRSLVPLHRAAQDAYRAAGLIE